MADGVTMKFDLPDFNRQMKALEDDMQQRVVRSAVGASATVFKKLAVANAPVLKLSLRTHRIVGLLKRSIYSGRSRSSSKPGLEFHVVSVRRKGKGGGDPFYWPWVEAGHIAMGGRRAKGGARVRALRRERALSAGKFVKGREFLGRAFRSGQNEAVRVFFERIEKRILKANADK